jgi:light-regulated signal transduction histidine kinase (bacteriophytochrome)
LRSIVGFSRFLSKEYGDKLDEKGQDYIRRLSNAAGRMKTLIDDLLAYSRVGREVAEEETDCQAVFADELETLQLTIEEAGAAVTHDALPRLRMDSSLFRQVIRNLTGNALKYRGEKSPQIHVSAQRESGEWVFSVRDNGIGIDPQYSERIFGVFQRLHSRDEYSGTGIGLAICKKAAQRLGGRIWVESEVGRGSVFYFTVPQDHRQTAVRSEDTERQIA